MDFQSSEWATAAAKSLQLCPTLCDPTDGSPPGSTIPEILQARTLEWVAISFSNAWEWKVKVKSLSPIWLFATPWTAAHQAPPSMGFSRQEYWSGVPLPSPGLLPSLNHFFWEGGFIKSSEEPEPVSSASDVSQIAACPPSPIAHSLSALPASTFFPSSNQ